MKLPSLDPELGAQGYSLFTTCAPFLAVTQSLVPSSAMSRICSPKV
jgi:hypothetical protein